jgi:hypothetical protein
LIAFYRNNWYYVAGVAFVAIAYFMGFWGDQFSRVQVILIYNLMTLFLHQFEEYALPGGAPLVINVALYGEKKDYDRYPGNKQSSMLVNSLAYPFFIAPVVFPNLIWLGLAQVFFGFTQIVGHGVIMNIKSKTWYNPGLATAVLLHLPIGVYYIYYVSSRDLVAASDLLYGLAVLVVAILVIIRLPIRLYQDRNSPYPLTAEEMARFNMLEKLRTKGIL